MSGTTVITEGGNKARKHACLPRPSGGTETRDDKPDRYTVPQKVESAKEETQAEEGGREWGGDPQGPTAPATVPGVSSAGRGGEERASWTRAPASIHTPDQKPQGPGRAPSCSGLRDLHTCHNMGQQDSESTSFQD